MKNAFLLSALWLALLLGLQAQSETEPNNTFGTANYLSEGSIMNGNLDSGSGDANDYFVTVPDDDGTIVISFSFTGGLPSSNFLVYAYSRNQSSLGTRFLYNQASGADSLVLHCRQQDSIFIRISASGQYTYQFTYTRSVSGPADLEPNDSFAEAVTFAPADTVRGRIGYRSVSPDNNDYFLTVLPVDGTFRCYLEYDNTSGSAFSDFFSYFYSKNQGSLATSFQYNQALGITRDTVTIHCRAADTLYIRIASTGCFTYSFHYEMLPAGPADLEPNDSFEEAVTFAQADTVKGRIGYRSATADNNDYFLTVLPDDGTFRCYLEYDNTSGSASSDFLAYFYSKNRSSLATSFQYNQPLGISRDTVTIHGRAADTLYIRIASSGCFSYQLHYDLLPAGPSDPEPNDSFDEAAPITHADTVYGRIGYRSVTTDNHDYFITALPEDGTFRCFLEYDNTSGSASSNFFSYFYSKNRGSLGTSFKYNQPLGVSRDTVTIHCRAADTLYIRISSSGSFSYQFRYEMETAGTADLEPNNSIATATPISLRDTLRGRVGYMGVSRDTDDYFKFHNDRRRSIRAFVRGQQTSSAATANFTVTVGRLSGGTLFNQTLTGIAPGAWDEVLDFACLPEDSLYLRLRTSQCMAYEFGFEWVENEPEAAFEVVRFGNEVAFMSQITQADSFVWDLGGGVISHARFPTQNYLAGVYPISLTAINQACNFQAVVRDTLSITGIESYSPQQAGTDVGVGYFVMRIFGVGLDTSAVIQLVRGATVITPNHVLSPNVRELTARFSLQDVPLGSYDLQIVLSNGDIFNFPEGFEIFDDQGDHKLIAEVTGPARVRTDRWMNCALNVSNERARMALGVMAFIVAPKWVELDIAETLHKQSGKLSIKGNVYDQLTIDPDDFNQVYFDGTFDPMVDTVLIDYDEIYSVFDSLVSFDISQLYHEPLDAKVYPILIPLINGNSTYSYQFKMRSTRSAEVKIRSYAWPFTVRNNPNTGQMLDYVHTAGLNAAAVAEMAPNPALKAIGKSAAYIDIGSQVAFTEFYDWWYGTNVADGDYYARQGLALTANLAASKLPNLRGGATSAMYRADVAKRATRDATEYIRFIEGTVLRSGKLDPNMARRLSGDLLAFKDFLKKSSESNLVTNAQKEAAIYALGHVLSRNGVNLSTNELGQLLFPDDQSEYTGQKPETMYPDLIKLFDFEAITSFDPNEIYGNQGVGPGRYIRRREAMNYLIAFENVDTARAPAQIVRVYTQLDPALFDLSQTWLGHITIAGQLYTFEEDRQSLFRDIDLRPRLDLIVRVAAKIDTLTGRISWEFISLDPETMDLTEEPLAGFLPPNVNFPEGEGSVSFRSRLKPSVAHLAELPVFADIYFDDNAPIRTNTWRNTVDEAPPVTNVLPQVQVTSDTLMEISLQGGDTESGLQQYYLYVKKEGHDWIPNPLPIGLRETLTLTGEIDATYDFYVIGTDSVGNRETKTPRVEASVTLSRDLDVPFVVYPNPATAGTATLRASGPQGEASVALLDLMGRRVGEYTRPDWNGSPWTLDLAGLSPGIYLVQIRTASHAKPRPLKLWVQPY